MQTESTYRIRNWSEYNKALIQRGSISIWVEENTLRKWFSSEHTCSAGRPATYSDDAILMLLTIREVFKLPLRMLEGFAKSLFKKMGFELPVPSYTQISRRAQTLFKKIQKLLGGNKKCDIIFDSTGLKVYGEGAYDSGKFREKVHQKGGK